METVEMDRVVPPHPPVSRITRARQSKHTQQLIRYATVSVIGTAVTQLVLASLLWGHLAVAVVANIIAVTVGSVPAYVLNRAWVWQKRGKSHWRKEVLPFWGMALLGLIISTIVVAIVASGSNHVILTANLGSFGALWVFKYVVFEKWMFGPQKTSNISNE